MTECLYCGAASRSDGRPVHVCVCGRSGHWEHGYRPKLIDWRVDFDVPEWLRFLRRLWYSTWPVNESIIAEAMASVSQGMKKP